MSRKIKYDEAFLKNLWSEYQGSGKKLKEYCKDTIGPDGKPLNYISIYTALRKNGIMKFIKKKTNVQPVETATV